jgi:hypothetical protein
MTVNEAVSCPLLEIVHDEPVTMLGSGVLAIDVQEPESPDEKPLPVTVTTVLTGPELGTSEIEGEVVVTMNEACAKSPPLPVTVIV